MLGTHIKKIPGKNMIYSIENEEELAETAGIDIKVAQIFCYGPLRYRMSLDNEEITYIKNQDRLKIYVHNSYVTPFKERNASLGLIRKQLNISKRLNAVGMIIHLSNIEKEDVLKLLKKVNNKTGVTIYFELIVKKDYIYDNPENVIELLNYLEGHNIGLCLDTCHLYQNGIPLSSYDDTMCYFDNYRNLSVPLLIHLNDSKYPPKYLDHHAPIGTNIWKNDKSGFKAILEFAIDENCAIIIEEKSGIISDYLHIKKLTNYFNI